MALRPELLSLCRFVAAITEDSPEPGRAFTSHITQPVVARVADTLRPRDDAAALARICLRMLQGTLWSRALIEPQRRPSRRAVHRQTGQSTTLAARAFG